MRAGALIALAAVAIAGIEVQRFYDLGRIAERGSVSETELDPFGS